MNTSGIIPVDTKVLVFPDPIEEKTAGGLYIPETSKERQKYATQKATFIAAGASCFADWAGDEPLPGGRILMAQYAGTLIKGDDGKEYRICNDEDIICKLGKQA